jgi:ankyrin repeat protein
MKVRHIMALVFASVFLLTISLAAANTDVADAAMRRDRTAVQALLQKGANVNAPQSDGARAIHWAVYNGDLEMTKMLIAAGADVKVANRDGATPLWLASTNGDATIIRALLDGGADANEVLPLGRTPLMLASRTGAVEAMRVLIDRGANLNARDSERGTTPMMWAADQGHAAAVKLLIDRGADLAARSAPAARGRGPALGKSSDPRASVKRQVDAIIAEQGQLPDLSQLRAAGENNNAAAGARGNANANNANNNNDGGDDQDNAGAAAGFGGGGRGRQAATDGGQLTPLIYAARANSIDTVRVLLDAGADVNHVSGYGWSPLLVATQNRFYLLGKYLIERGANVNLANKGGWTPLYLATDNRNIEGGDYPVRPSDMDDLEYIKQLLDKGADVNARMIDSTETRTVFTNQWLDERGATAFLRASQSGDLELMKLLLAHGADPKITTNLNVSALQVAAGIGWVEGITSEHSTEETVEAVRLLLDLGLDPNAQALTGRVALHGAGHKGATEVVKLLVSRGARMDIRDWGNTDNRGSPELAAHTWLPVDYADGLVRVGVQSAIAHPETGKVFRELMKQAGLDAPPEGRKLDSICIVEICSTNYDPKVVR